MPMSTTALAVRILLIFLALNARYADTESNVCDGFDHCEYNGNMCAIDPDSCVREMLMKRKCVNECRLVFDASGKVYTPRDPIEYRLEIGEDVLEEDFYAETLSYSIVKGNRNWSIPDSFKQVDGCCSLKLTETCTLPPRDHVDDRYYAILPLNQGDRYDYYGELAEKKKFCLYSIQEQAVSYEFCEIKEEPGCLELVNGIPQRKRAFIPLNSGIRSTFEEDTTCVFAAPRHYINNTDVYGSFIARGVKYSEFGGENYVFFPNGKNLTCEVRENSPGNVLPQVELAFDGQGEYYCELLLYEDKKKGSTPWCTNHNPVEDEGEGDSSTVVAAVISSIAIAIFIVILVICASQKHLKELTYKKSVKDIPDVLKVDKLEDMLLVDENSNQHQKEKSESIDIMSHTEWKDNEKGAAPPNRIDSGFEDEIEEAADQISRDNGPMVEDKPARGGKLHSDSEIGKANGAIPSSTKSDVEISSLPDSGIGSAHESRHGSMDAENKNNSEFSVVFQPASDGYVHKDRVLAANELSVTSVPSYVAHNRHEGDSDIFEYNFMVDSQCANDGYADKNRVLAANESGVTSAPSYVVHICGEEDLDNSESTFMVDSQRVNDGYVDKNRVLEVNDFEATAVPSYASHIHHQECPEMTENDYPAPGDYIRHH